MAKKENKFQEQQVIKEEVKEYIDDANITEFMMVVNDNDDSYPTFEEIDKVTDVSIITGETRIIDEKVVYLEYDRSFSAKLILLSDEKKSYYKKVRNTFNAYTLTLKTTWKNEEFYANDKLVAKFGVRGKSLYLYLVKNKDNNTFVRICICSNRAVKIAKELVKEVMEKLNQQRTQVKPLKYHIDLERQEKLVEKGLIKLIKTKDIIVFQEELSIKEEDLAVVEEIQEEPVEEIQEEPVEEIQEEPVEEVQEEPVEEIQEEPVEEIQEEPVEEVQEEPVEEIQEEPVEEIQEEPVEEIQEEPVEEIQKEPVQQASSQISTKGLRRGIRLKRKPNKHSLRF